MSIQRFHATNTNLQIKKIIYNVMSPDEMRKQGRLQCINYNLYSQDAAHEPQKYSVMDARLGTGPLVKVCPTCEQKDTNCLGHFGYIELTMSIFHYGYFKQVLNILKCICLKCGHVLLGPEDRLLFYMKCTQDNMNMIKKKAIFKQILEKCKKVKICPKCSAIKGMVKKVALLKIVHEEFKHLKPDCRELAEFTKRHENVIEDIPDLKNYFNNKYMDLLIPGKIKHIFRRIPQSDHSLLMLACNPSDLFWTCIPIPPTNIRPSVIKGSTRSEMGMTIQLSELVYCNEYFRRNLYNNEQQFTGVADKMDFMQYLAALFINSDISGIPQDYNPKKKHKGLSQRLKGKTGRFRCNLSGKRVNFTARTVISPNPHLKINEVGIPLYCAKILTYPQKVTKYNINMLRTAVLNGPSIYPGACFVNDGFKKALQKVNVRENLAKHLKIGHVVHRHLVDGDVVLFNRQPSLHKLSIMAHFVKVLPHRTFRFNECVCTPYNADFDGDEMNVHLPQTEDARAEAINLMSATLNLCTPKNGELIIGAIQDFITGAYLLTHIDKFFNSEEANVLLGTIINTYEKGTLVELPQPAILKPKKLWTGKQLFSLIIRPNSSSEIKINLDTRTKMKTDMKDKNGCPDDTFVTIRNSEFMSGYLDKSILGSGSKKNIFYILFRDYAAGVAAEAMWRMAKMMAYFTSSNGFSIGINDVTATKELNRVKDDLLNAGNKKCDITIAAYKDKSLQPIPGCTMKQQMEGELLKTLSNIREDAGIKCKELLPKENAPVLMSVCGSKGSLINVSQMVALVGQQSISGNLVPYGYIDRTLPFFDKEENTPEARGFVKNSFYSGLEPTEFFFHTMAGREGLVDTAVKTADSGYMQRRLIKGLEDLCVHQDGSVRTSNGELIQLEYGDDMLDPSLMETDTKPVDFDRLMIHCRTVKSFTKSGSILKPQDILTESEKLFEEDFNPIYKNEILDFLKSYAEKVALVYNKSQTFDNKETSSVWLQQYFLTDVQLKLFVDTATTRYNRAIIEPGTAIGALCAQSIGEPTTQMTLKTFHFAGVASMNITQGVPRIKEIIDAKKEPSTPIIEIKLLKASQSSAFKIKKQLVQFKLGDISNIDIVLADSEVCYKITVVDADKHLLNTSDIQEALINSKLKFTGTDISLLSKNKMLCALPAKLKKDKGYKLIEERLIQLNNVLVSGVKTIVQAVIKEEKGVHFLLCEGTGLLDAMLFNGVDCENTLTNNIYETAKVFGLETARDMIALEMKKTMSGHGITIDPRHMSLLSEIMTASGDFVGFTRQGFSKTKSCTLMLASYEQTMDHLFEAAYHGQTDIVSGVSESIILGNPIQQGTNCFNLTQTMAPQKIPEEPKFLSDSIVNYDSD